MYKFLVDNGQRIAFGLGMGLTILFFVFALSGMEEFSMLAKEEQFTTGIFDVGLFGSLVLIVIAAVAMVGFGIFQILGDVKGSMKGLLGLFALLAIFFAAFATSPGEETGAVAESIQRLDYEISPSSLKFIGGSIITSLVLILIAAAAFIFFEIRNFFK